MDAVQANVLGATTPTLSLKSLSSPTSASITSSQSSSVPPPGVLPPVVLQQPSNTNASSILSTEAPSSQITTEELVKQKQEELQKKLMDEGEPTLQQQESMSIKGQNARHLVMQRLMRPRDSKVVILRNMVGPEDVDETLQEEIQDECSKYGAVEKVIIYKEKQTDNDDDDFDDVIVKIFVEFSMTSGRLCKWSSWQWLLKLVFSLQKQIKQAQHSTDDSLLVDLWRLKATINPSLTTMTFPVETNFKPMILSTILDGVLELLPSTSNRLNPGSKLKKLKLILSQVVN